MINAVYNIMYCKITIAHNIVIKDILMIHLFVNHVFQDVYNAILKIIINVQFVI